MATIHLKMMAGVCAYTPLDLYQEGQHHTATENIQHHFSTTNQPLS
jgi:hypothetical protein